MSPRAFAILLLCALACTGAASTAPARAQTAGSSIVGGSDATIEGHPYQVYVRVGGFFCGGSIRDATHVVTAAHCVTDEAGGYPQLVPPGSVRIAFGVDDLRSIPDSNRREVTSVAVDRRYLRRITGADFDSAVLTLASAIPLDGATARAIEPVDPAADAAALGSGRPATVSGFGVTSTGAPSPVLQKLGVPLIADPSCETAYERDFVPSAMVCAGGVLGEDSCFGDSGGPLVVDTDPDPAVERPKLAGIVSFGSENCGDPTFPGVYTEVAEASTRAFLSNAGAVGPPSVFGVDPIVSGPLQVGANVSCTAPPGRGEPTQFFFSALNSTGTATGLSSSTSPVLSVPPAAAGQRLVCDARYENEGGFGYATGVPTATTVPFPANTSPAVLFDRTRPTSRITRLRCAGRVCTTSLTASDATSGVRSLIVTLHWSRTKCRGRGIRRTCRTDRLTRRLRAGALGGGRYRVVTGRLAPRRYRITILATDIAGNRQAKPATRTFRVTRRG